MDFELTETQRMLREATRKLARQRLAPGAREREKQHEIPHELIRELAEMGLCGINVPEELGGAAAGAVAYTLAIRELAAADAAVAVTLAVTNMVAELIATHGTTEQRQRFVPPIVSGEFYGAAFALSEAGAGSDVGSMTTRAVRRPGGYSLTGEKMWVSHGDARCPIAVWARTGGPGTNGLSCFIVEPGAPGLHPGKPIEKMGLRASHTVPLTLDEVEVREDARLGAEGQGFGLAMAALDGGRIGVAAQAVGLAAAALERACDYALARQQGGKSIAEHQAIQFKLADMAAELEASFLLTLQAAWFKEQGRPFTRQAAMAKLYASEATNRAVREAVQILGGYGYMEEYEVARLFRDSRVTQIYEGTSEIQRLVIAREILEMS